MADNFKYVQAQNFSLAGSGAVIGATTLTLKSFKTIDAVNLAMTDFGTIGFMTLEPGNGTLEEQICFTGVTQNSNGTATLTGVSSVTFVSPYTQTSGLLKTHAGSTIAVISNTAGFYDNLSGKADDETVTGTWTFPDADGTRARIATDTDTAIATAFVTLGQLSRQAISGASNASTTAKGIVEEATQAEVLAKTAAGSTAARLFVNPTTMPSTLLSDYKADTGAADVYVITPAPALTAYVTGQRFTFKVSATNLTTTPTVNVNALGAKTIVKQGAQALSPGDLLLNQIVEVEYDGTNMQLMTPVASQNPVGSMQMYAGSSAPSGYVLCDGSSLLRAGTYAALFTAISTTYGTADGTHFNVPDMRGRIPVGVGTGTGGAAAGTGLPTGGSALTAIPLAGWKGEETHLLTSGESGVPAHVHDIYEDTAAATSSNFKAGSVAATNGSVSGTIAGYHAVANATANAASAHNVIQPQMGVNFIIKY